MCYTFTLTDPDDYTPHGTGDKPAHALKLRDKVDAHTSMTHVLGLTTAELKDLQGVITARLLEYTEDTTPPRFHVGSAYQYRNPRTGELTLWPYLRVENGWQPVDSYLDGGVIYDDNPFVNAEWLDNLVKIGGKQHE